MLYFVIPTIVGIALAWVLFTMAFNGNSNFVNRWIWAFIGGLFLGALVQGVVQAILPDLLPEKPVMVLLPLDLSLGLTIGALQALVLRRYLVRAWIWVIATGVGVAAAEVIAGFILHDKMGLEFGFYRSPLSEALAALVIVGVTLGVCVGSAQWLVFFQAGYRFRSLLWIPVSIIGFTAAIAVADYLTVPEALIFSLFGLLAGLILGGVIYGVLTGFVFTRFISNQQDTRD